MRGWVSECVGWMGVCLGEDYFHECNYDNDEGKSIGYRTHCTVLHQQSDINKTSRCYVLRVLCRATLVK